MVKKILLSVLMVAVSFLTGYATAQSYFLGNTPASTNSGGRPSAMSSSDFQSQVQEMQEKKNKALTDQLKQDLAKVPPTPPPSTAPAGTSTSPDQTLAPEGHTSMPETSQAPAAAAPAPMQPMEEAAPPGPLPAMPPARAPKQSQVYTGFQNSSPKQNQSPMPSPGSQQNQSTPSGNWNIKY